jgi:hypothetical protein
MAQVISRRPLTAETLIRARINPRGICGGESGSGTGFSQSSSVFPCQYHSTVALQTPNVSRHPRLGFRPTPHSRKKIPSFHATWRFIAMLTTVFNRSLNYARLIQSTNLSKSILVLSFNLRDPYKTTCNKFPWVLFIHDRLCGLVASVENYKHRGPGFDSRALLRIFLRELGLERGPLSLVIG